MKLHLPKVLFAAVVAAVCCVQQAGAADYTVYNGYSYDIVQWTGGTEANKLNGICYGPWKVATFDASGAYTTESSETRDTWQECVTSNDRVTLLLDENSTAGSEANAYYDIDGVKFSGIIVTATSSVSLLKDNGGNRSISLGGTENGATGYTTIAKDFKLSNENSTSAFSLVGTQQWTIDEGATFALKTGSSSINQTGNLTIAGDGTVDFQSALTIGGNLIVNSSAISISGTLTNNGTLTFGENTTVTLSSAITGSGTSITFGEGAAIILSDTTALGSSGALEHETYGYKVNRSVDLLSGSLTANREVTVTVNGEEMTMEADGTVAGLSDNNYYISGDTSASAINASGDSIGTDTNIRMNGGKLTMDADFTVSGSALITATTIEGEGILKVAEGATVQVNSTGQILKSNMEIAAGGTMEFLGTGADAINYGQTGRTITVAGTMDVGTTRQTVGNWTFDLLGGTIKGAGQSAHSNIGLDFHAASTVNAKAATGATAEAPTVSTISTKVRYNGALNVNVEENARLDVTGAIVAGNKLTKSGAGTLRLANNDNDYSNKAFDVTGGTLELRDNGKTLNGAVTVSNGATLALLQTDGSANTLANVTLNNGSLLTQSSGANYTTTLTSLAVGDGGATIGTQRDEVYGNNSWQTTLAITALTGTGDLTVTSMSNTSNATTIRVDGGTGYSGTVKVQNSTAANGRITNLALNSDTALAGAVVELGGGAKDASGVTTNLVLSAATTAVKGIQDAAGRKSAGNVIGSNTVSTLTIDTGDASYSTTSGVKNSINLVKKGSGTQTFGGDMGSFGSTDGDTDGTIEIQGGKLAFTKADGSMNVQSLTLNGGTMEVTGALTLNTVDVDLDAYFNSGQLSTTLVTAGTLSGWSESIVGSYMSNGTQYTSTISQSGNSLVLTFAESTTLLVDSATLTGAVLTLNIDANLTDVSSVDLMLSEAALADIKGMSGLVSLSLVAADGTFTTVATDGATLINNVTFYNGAYAGEGAGMYQIAYIPEPTTATLSLLALAGLAARRRRK